MNDLSDPISRQQTITALRALSDEDGYISAPHEVVTDVVRGLPPVWSEHEQTTQSEQGDSDKFGVKTSETCEDCISRQAAIDAVESMLRRKFCIGGDLAEITLAGLPSAQPEIIRCTECKHYREYDSKYVENAVVVQCMADRYPISETIPDGWFCAGAERKDDE